VRADADIAAELLRVAKRATAAGNHGLALLLVEASAAIERNRTEQPA